MCRIRDHRKNCLGKREEHVVEESEESSEYTSSDHEKQSSVDEESVQDSQEYDPMSMM